MYYILNEANHVIAADNELLSFCGVSLIDELYLAIALKKIQFITAPHNKLMIDNGGEKSEFPASQTSLSSMLGHLTLVSLQAKETNRQLETPLAQTSEETKEEELFDTLNLFDDEATTTVTPTKKLEETTNTEKESITLDLFDDASPIEDSVTEVQTSKEEVSIEKESISLDIIEDIIQEEKITTPEISIEEERSPILINISEVSEKIGVSEEDYQAFFDEYIQTTQDVKADLEGEDKAKRSTAITTLSHLGYMLYLPEVGDILTHLGEIEEAEAKKEVGHFYATVARIKLTTQTEELKVEETPIAVEKSVKETTATQSKGFGTISLDDVKPIHFDFQLEQAANELSLPVELIEEFVNDFIEQAHTETIKMLKFYEEGNLDAIQKIGHLLKGASSNLRIVPLSDTLYQIQFCEDPKLLEGYILNYWAHFLSFQTQIKMISK